MSSVNSVVLIGNMGGDPELKYTPSGKAVANFSLATSMGKESPTQWHRVTVWEKGAESVAKYTKKGSQVCVEGRIEYRKYDDKDGVTRYTTDIVANRVTFLGSKPDADTEDFGGF